MTFYKHALRAEIAFDPPSLTTRFIHTLALSVYQNFVLLLAHVGRYSACSLCPKPQIWTQLFRVFILLKQARSFFNEKQ